jgi:inositol 1,4,5-triphosphate receptor type 1/inositol 1,4,5-triphosphate receptor type 3
MEGQSDFLRYGAHITLMLADNQFVHSPGMIDVSVKLQTFPTYDPAEFNFSVFRVLPASMYNVQNEVLRRVKEISQAQEDAIGVLDESLEGEIKTNRQIYTNLKGHSVKFGATVQLQHLTSHRFLTVKGQENADNEKDNLKVTLEDYCSANTHFKVEHAFNYQKEGDEYVRLNDRVLLQLFVRELNKAVYLHSSAAGDRESPFSKLRSLSLTQRRSRLRDGMSTEVNASPEAMTAWTVCEYCPYVTEDTPYLKFGEYVWIKLSEQNAVLSVSQGEAITQPLALIFQSELHDTNGLWKVENEDVTKGGLVPVSKRLRFRHISTGRFLSTTAERESFADMEGVSSVIAESLVGKPKHELILVSDPDNTTLWELELISSRRRSKFTKKEEFYRIKHHYSELYIGPIDKEANKKVPGLVSSSEELTVVKIIRCEDSTVWETQFLLNSLPILKSFPAFIEGQNKVQEQSEFISRNREFKKKILLVRKCLKELDNFCKNKLQSMISLNRPFATIDPVRQKILREQYFIDALVELLKCTFTGVYDLAKTKKLRKDPEDEAKPQGVSLLSVEYTVAEHLQRVKHETLRAQLRELLDTVEDAYDLVMTVCQGNAENQAHTFRFCEVFIHHAAYLDKSISCLIAIIQNNEELLLKVATTAAGKTSHKKESVINKFLFLLRVLPT